MPDDSDLIVDFELPSRVNRGEFVCGVVRVRNKGKTPRDVSARLNLFEGDLRARLTGPAGRGRRIHGAYQVDSAPRRVSLQSGQALESGVFLFFTSAGLTFADAGEYRLQLEYDPSVREALVSDEQRLVVHELGNEKEHALAKVTLNVDLGRAVALAEPSPGEGRTRLEQFRSWLAGGPGVGLVDWWWELEKRGAEVGGSPAGVLTWAGWSWRIWWPRSLPPSARGGAH